MDDHDEEELQRAFRLSMQQPSPEAKRSKPTENADIDLQRELRAAAAERRRVSSGAASSPLAVSRELEGSRVSTSASRRETAAADDTQELPQQVATQLYSMVFGHQVSKDVLAQWCNQGFRFSTDPETAFGLVQHEGGPCGVLAPIQATLLKYLLFVDGSKVPRAEGLQFDYIQKTNALVQALSETLWRAGGGKRAVLAVLNIPDYGVTSEEEQDKDVDRLLQGLSLDSVDDLRRVVRVFTVLSLQHLSQQLRARLAGFRSRMGALLFLFSAMLSRDLDAVQSDRDDLGQPLVVPPFGHVSQEIVNLLLCGQAVANVFDGNYDIGGGMSLKGIPSNVEVGFLTLLESLNFCKVGQYLKCPKWPIWVVGSESHYTVLFALDTEVQDENDLELRETIIRRAFDSKDQSGGGGFINPEGLQQVLLEAKVNMPQETVDNLSSSDIVIWNDFVEALLQLEKTKGGLKDDEGTTGKKFFELHHFNGIAKTFGNNNNSGSSSSGGVVQQRPRLTKLRVSVPPKWTPESMMVEGASTTTAAAAGAAGTGAPDAMQTADDASSREASSSIVKEEAPQHAPLADCIRTRWQRATCNWSGDAPSIV